MKKEKTCCFTGHRDVPTGKFNMIKEKTESAIADLIKKGVDTFLCGGALGYDILCGTIVIKMQESNPDIKLILMLPHKEQDKFYDEKSKETYEYLKNHSELIVYTSKDYYKGCMHFRNRCMVENSAYLISYCRRHSGGSYYTKEYAAEQGLFITEITEENA